MSVVCVGLHILDVLGRPVSAIPPRQQVAFLEEIRMTVAGTAAATAIDLAKLGVPAATVGALGEDEMGDFIVDVMEAHHVDVRGLVRKQGVQTSATILPIRPSGERPALHVIGANALLSERDIPWWIVERASVLHLGGTFLMPGLDGEPTTRILRRAKELGVTTTMDFIPFDRPDLQAVLAPSLPYVDYLMPNLEDACTVAGTDDRAEAIRFFHDRGAACTLLTMGADGVSVCRRGEEELRLPAYEVGLVDTTGCGDAFSAGFIAGLVERLPLADAARLGLACGSLVATALGSDAGIVDRSQVERFMSETPTLPLVAAGDRRASAASVT